MKKSILSLFFLLFLLSGYCQSSKTVTISEIKIQTITCSYDMSIDMQKGDTTKYVYIGFQNSDYTHISDIRSIFFPLKDRTAITAFVIDLKSALLQLDSKTNLNWDKKEYSLYIYDFKNWLYLCEPKDKGSGCTILSKKMLTKLINWLTENGF